MSVSGVRKATHEGRLHASRTAGGHFVYDVAELDRYLGRAAPDAAPERIEAWYLRVSGTSGQDSSLQSQEEALRRTASGELFKVYRDRASGLNERRAGLTRLLADAEQGRFTVVRVTHADRLSRFGVPYLEHALKLCGVSLEVEESRAATSLPEELMADFMALIASFSGRFYRLRSREHQRRLLQETLHRLEDEA